MCGKLLHSAPKIRVLSLFPFKKKRVLKKSPRGGWFKRREKGVLGSRERGKKSKSHCRCNSCMQLGEQKGEQKKGLMQKKTFLGYPHPKRSRCKLKKRCTVPFSKSVPGKINSSRRQKGKKNIPCRSFPPPPF